MKPKEQIFKTGNPRPIRGRQIIAKSYLELNDEDYRDNPLIEVLPTEWDWSQQEIYDKLTERTNIDVRSRHSAARGSERLSRYDILKFRQYFRVIGGKKSGHLSRNDSA
jgi:hypothetical protein